MILTNDQCSQFQIAVQPVIEFLRTLHPHVKIVVTSTDAEILEGLAMTQAMEE